MRAVIQRVIEASVAVDDAVINSIGRGLCVLIGISKCDTKKDIDYMVKKLLNIRLFEDSDGKRWSKSVISKDYEILLVSQFTLNSILKGNKPDFHLSMDVERSQSFYEEFVESMKQAYIPDRIKNGAFGAYMHVNIKNDGPVTITLDSSKEQKDARD